MRLPQAIPTGITGRNSTKEVLQCNCNFQLPPAAHAARRHGKVDGMKTIAIRLEDETVRPAHPGRPT